MPKTVVSIRKRSEPPSLTESALVRAWPMWRGLTQYWASGASPPGFHFPMLPTTPKLPILISWRYTTRHRVFMKMRDINMDFRELQARGSRKLCSPLPLRRSRPKSSERRTVTPTNSRYLWEGPGSRELRPSAGVGESGLFLRCHGRRRSFASLPGGPLLVCQVFFARPALNRTFGVSCLRGRGASLSVG